MAKHKKFHYKQKWTDLTVSIVCQRLHQITPVCDGSTQMLIATRLRTWHGTRKTEGQCPILHLARFTEPLPDNYRPECPEVALLLFASYMAGILNRMTWAYKNIATPKLLLRVYCIDTTALVMIMFSGCTQQQLKYVGSGIGLRCERVWSTHWDNKPRNDSITLEKCLQL